MEAHEGPMRPMLVSVYQIPAKYANLLSNSLDMCIKTCYTSLVNFLNYFAKKTNSCHEARSPVHMQAI